jgi:hypothetical protein
MFASHRKLRLAQMVGNGFIPPFVLNEDAMTFRKQNSNYRLMQDYILRSTNQGWFSGIYSQVQHWFLFAR